MNNTNSLLLVDAIINLLLGVVLLAFPQQLMEFLGIASPPHAFFPSILGAVLFGIGLALLIQRKSHSGLGLAGAVVINLCGGIVLAFWLLFGSLALPLPALVGLWGLVAVLVGLSTIEWKTNGRQNAT